MAFPVAIGGGLRVFPESRQRKPFKLTETKTFDSGVIVKRLRAGLSLRPGTRRTPQLPASPRPQAEPAKAQCPRRSRSVARARGRERASPPGEPRCALRTISESPLRLGARSRIMGKRHSDLAGGQAGRPVLSRFACGRLWRARLGRFPASARRGCRRALGSEPRRRRRRPPPPAHELSPRLPPGARWPLG
jgi:hypothetical protein